MRIAPIVAGLLLVGCSGMPLSHHKAATLSGPELYQRLCASCHGADGRGSGPVEPALRTPVPDLTLLAHRDGGEFPTEDVRRTIDGRWSKAAHGSRDMPVWGWQLFDMSSTDTAGERAQVDSMIDRLVAWLASIQRP
jgi:mono/diheme cytochrome c family protein